MKPRKRVLVASALILLWVGLAAWQWHFMEEPLHVPLTNITGLPGSGEQVTAAGTSRRVQLELLASASVHREATFTAPRNMFVIPRPDGVLPLSEDRVSEERQDSVSEETVAEQVEAEEPTQYKYLGFLHVGEGQQKRKDMAVLSKDDEVMMLRVGDRVDDHLILRSITAESVTVRDTESRTEKTVQLSDDPVGQE
ncbi:MAG: hypothetical protein IPM58_12370 [Nitrospira sp.]|nr:hypothetical protein [Nitrospira sp.]